MARLLHRRWEPELASGLSRRDRQGCDYEAYVPDPLLNRVLTIDGSVAAAIADAEAAVARLNVEAVALVDSEALARLLLRTDAVASSRIEGLEVGGRRLLRAEAARELGDNPSDVTAEEGRGIQLMRALALLAFAPTACLLSVLLSEATACSAESSRCSWIRTASVDSTKTVCAPNKTFQRVGMCRSLSQLTLRAMLSLSGVCTLSTIVAP